jgi:hypothetical protein
MLSRTDARTYGDTTLSFFTTLAAPGAPEGAPAP